MAGVHVCPKDTWIQNLNVPQDSVPSWASLGPVEGCMVTGNIQVHIWWLQPAEMCLLVPSWKSWEELACCPGWVRSDPGLLSCGQRRTETTGQLPQAPGEILPIERESKA